MPKKKPEPSEWLEHLERLASGGTPGRAFMVGEATLEPALQEKLGAMLRRAGADAARLPDALAAIADLVADVKAMHESGIDALPPYRAQQRHLGALARACDSAYRSLAALAREPHGLDFVFRHFYGGTLDPVEGPEGTPSGFVMHNTRRRPDARLLADWLISGLKRGALFIGPAAAKRARELAAVRTPNHRPRAGIPRYAVRELAAIWTRETGRDGNRSGSEGGDGGPFVQFCALAIRDGAELKVDVEELVREYVARKRGKQPRARGKKKVKATTRTTNKKVVRRASVTKKPLKKKAGTKKRVTKPVRARGGRK